MAERQLLVNADIFDGDGLLTGHGVLVADGRIEAVLPVADFDGAGVGGSGSDGLGRQGATAARIDLAGALLVPGFIDLQVNGGGGALFNTAPTVDSLRRIGAAHRRFGTVGFLPTVITDDYSVMRAAAAAVDAAMAVGAAGVLGIHFEGPFLNPAFKGAHDAARMRRLDDEGFDILTSLSAGKTLVTLAPECVGVEDVARLVAAGVIVSAGHSAADYAQTHAALTAGLAGFTHLFNAMPPVRGRAPGIVGAALEDEGSWFGIIADGHHVHPALLRLAVRAKARGGAVLVTDAMPTVGGDATAFTLHGEAISLAAGVGGKVDDASAGGDRGQAPNIQAGGVCVTADGTLAGSNLNMLAAVNNAAAYAGIDWFEAARMASLYPARALGLDGQLGRIAAGYRASFLVLDKDRNILETWIDGKRG